MYVHTDVGIRVLCTRVCRYRHRRHKGEEGVRRMVKLRRGFTKTYLLTRTFI